MRPWITVKPFTPVIGIDDGGFNRLLKDYFAKVPVYGVIMKGATHIDGIIQTEIDKDSLLATNAIIKMIKSSNHFLQLRAIFLEGITIGGFGIVDINRLYDELKIPVIVIVRKKPNFRKIRESLLKVFSDADERWSLMCKAGELRLLEEEKKIFVHLVGIGMNEAKKLITYSTQRGNLPEALRIAHLIGSSYYHFKMSQLEQDQQQM